MCNGEYQNQVPFAAAFSGTQKKDNRVHLHPLQASYNRRIF